MEKIIIFSGTTEGKTISDVLSLNKIKHFVCVATDFGRVVMEENDYADILVGRLDKNSMCQMIKENKADMIIDATHPYATEATDNIKSAADECGIEYIRILRKAGNSGLNECSDITECVEKLSKTDGNILLTTGSKDLELFSGNEAIRSRLFVRVIPSLESIDKCEKLGINSKQIIAMVGPFDKEINKAIIRQYDIKVLVTKDSGKNGGFEQKVSAAIECGCEVFIVGRKTKEQGLTVGELLNKLGLKRNINVTLIGIGAGNSDGLLISAKDAINRADILLGANRMVEAYSDKMPTKALYKSEDILAFIKEMEKSQEYLDIAVLFSGDTGFCSGATKLVSKLTGMRTVNVSVIPGISSISYLASKIGEPYSDAALLSLHGKDESDIYKICDEIKSNERSYILTSGSKDIYALIDVLKENIHRDLELIAGYNLSYEDEEIFALRIDDSKLVLKEGLYVLFIKNNNFESKKLNCLLADDEFIRDKIPMTKSLIRHVCVQKLGLCKDSIVADIGAGTGSVAIEIAKQSAGIMVYAIEKKSEAVSLIIKNAEKFNAHNLKVIEGNAADVLDRIDKKFTHAFIGGSSGELKAIVEKLIDINPSIRIVASAISVETIAELNEIAKEYEAFKPELISINYAKNKRVGDYNLMEGMNPVYILSMGGSNA